MGVIGVSIILGAVVYFITRPRPFVRFFWTLWGQSQVSRVENGSTAGCTQHGNKTEGLQRNDKNGEKGTKRPDPDETKQRTGQTPQVTFEDEPDDDGQETPKATAEVPLDPIPTFSLSSSMDEHEGEHEDEHEDDHIPPPKLLSSPPALSVPSAASSARAASSPGSMPSPPRPGLMAPPPRIGLMAPPPLPRPGGLPSIAQTNGVATTSSPLSRSTLPIPNRGPPSSSSSSSSSLAPPPTIKTKPKKSSRLVALAPGHSPLDWARISGPNADLRNLPPQTPYLRVTPSMLKHHDGRKGRDAWSAFGGRVYNVTPYVDFHPGGEGELLRGAGKDATKLFAEIHPWVNYETMLAACLVGVLVDEGEGGMGGGRAKEGTGSGAESKMDEMD